jgi:hypothetical protein
MVIEVRSKAGVSLSADQHILQFVTEVAGVNYNWIQIR